MNRLLVILFVGFISLPLAANLAGIDGADAANENREMSPFPRWTGTWKSAVDYPAAFAGWFEDHFGFRAQLVKWNAGTRLFGLGSSSSRSVVVGRDGWFFYGDDGALDDYANDKPLTAPEVGLWRDALVRAHHWLRWQHIAYVFTIAPDKHVVYSEYMPASIRRVQSTSRTDQVLAALESTHVPRVDLRQPLFAAKARDRVYFKTDTHWNDRGAFAAYRAIIEAARAQLPAIPPPWDLADFKATDVQTTGRDLAGMLGLKRVLHEDDVRLVPVRPRQARAVDPLGAEPMSELGRLVTEIPGSTLPRAVVFRDSFVSRLVPFLSEHFSRVVYLWQNDFDSEVIANEHPDIVIEEIVGRHLYTFLASPELVPQ
jgi:alginate O-acetyltransferase complex protein AlgJ